MKLFFPLEQFSGAKLNYTRLPVRGSDPRAFVEDIAKGRNRLAAITSNRVVVHGKSATAF